VSVPTACLCVLAVAAAAKSQGAVVLLKQLLESYTRVLTAYPYATKIISSGLIGGMGDILIQAVQGRKSGQSFSLRRLVVFSSVAALYIAPVIHVWFNWLNVLPIPSAWQENAVAKAAAMMLVDQTVGATVITIGFFYAFELANQLLPPYAKAPRAEAIVSAGNDQVKQKLWPTLVANWYCWPIINFVNFLVIPIEYRVLFSNAASVFWNMFLSSIANKVVK
jgi:Mpv17 / PMP22 family